MKEITQEILNNIESECLKSPRKRAHFNIHPKLDDPIQRLVVFAEKGTYIRPHRHTEEGKFELFIILNGEASVLMFDNHGRVLSISELKYDGTRMVEIPPKAWHTLVVKEQSTLVEIKPGPYTPLSDKDFATWAPKEGENGAVEFEKRIREAKVGDLVKL